MNKKRFILLSIILFVVALIVYTSNIEKGNIDNEIKIGGIFALTGVGADQGEQELNAGLMAVSDINARAGINGRKIKLITGDVSIDKLGMAVSVVKKEIDIEKVVSIVGTTWDEPASVIVPIADKDKIPMIGQNQTRMIKENNSYPYFFSTWYDNEIGIRKMLEYAQKQNWKRIAIIRPAPIGFYEYVAQKVKLLSEEYGVSIVGNENLNNPAATDFRTPLTKIKALNPDAIVVVLGGLTECPFLKQEKELGMNIPVLATESALNSISLNQCSSIMENLYISYPKETKKYRDFAKRYFDMFQKFPETPSVMTTYDAFMILADVLRKTDGKGGDELRMAISKTRDFQGTSLDLINFDDMGYVITPLDSFEIRSVRQGKYVSVF